MVKLYHDLEIAIDVDYPDAFRRHPDIFKFVDERIFSIKHYDDN